MTAATQPFDQRLRIAVSGARRGASIVFVVMGLLFAGLLSFYMQPLRLLHNVTPSLREGVGFYVYDSTKVRHIARGDIIVFNYLAPDWITQMGWPVKDRDIHIKRVYGLPGDTIQTTDAGEVRVCASDGGFCSNFQRLREDSKGQKLRWIDLPAVIPDDAYFVAGEHWFSLDSRYHGVVQAHALLGTVVKTYTTPVSTEELTGANRRGDDPPVIPDVESLRDPPQQTGRALSPPGGEALPSRTAGHSSIEGQHAAFDVAVFTRLFTHSASTHSLSTLHSASPGAPRTGEASSHSHASVHSRGPQGRVPANDSAVSLSLPLTPHIEADSPRAHS